MKPVFLSMTRVLAAVAFTLVLALAGSAAAVNYGTFSDPTGTVTYVDVADVSGLYGAPNVSLNSLDFTPTQFEANCSIGAGCSGTETTTDTLTMDIIATGGQQITEIGITEGLNYSIQAFGSTTAFASVTVTADVFVDVFEVNGSTINGVSDSFQVSFAPSNNFTVVGPTGIDSGLINGDLTIDILSILTDSGITGEATGVRISFANTLQAFHDGGGGALIRKRDTDFVSLTINGGNPIPEPTTGILLLGGLAVLAARRERSR